MENCGKCTCPECKITFTVVSGLRQHLRKFHPNIDVSSVAPLKRESLEFHCKLCSRAFSYPKDLNFHMRRSHGESSACVVNLKCPWCLNESFQSRNSIIKHFGERHGLKIEKRTLEFSSLGEFNHWKEEMERETKSSFIQQSKKSDKHFYACHRSGKYSPKVDRQRKLKELGSRKINGFCPARIVVSIKEGKYEVEFVGTHAGHDMEVGHLSLTVGERERIAAKIAAGIPFQAILDTKNLSGLESERQYQLSIKDLQNIKRTKRFMSYDAESLAMDCGNDRKEKEVAAIIREIDDSSMQLSHMEKRKETLKKEFIEIVDCVSSCEEVDALQELVLSLRPNILAVRSKICALRPIPTTPSTSEK